VARVIDPNTGKPYTHCIWCSAEIEESGLRSFNAQDLCLDCSGED
jgi:hypothetical protein